MIDSNSADFLRITRFVHEMTEIEKDVFLTCFIGAGCFDTSCALFNFLKNNDFEGFKAHVIHMTCEGEKIKQSLQGVKL